MTTTLRFNETGQIACLYTEAVDLRELGRLHVVRATDIRFSVETQRWEVHCANTGRTLYRNPSREACLTWEKQNLQPQSQS